MEPFAHLHRRRLLTGAGALLASACSPEPANAGEAQYAASPYRRVSDAEWRRRLGEDAWRILRHEGTERPYASPLNQERRRGTFVCRGCDLPLFRSSWKFDSGTGWPSFYTVMSARGPNTIAPDTWATRATSSTTARDRQGCATATTASR